MNILVLMMLGFMLLFACFLSVGTEVYQRQEGGGWWYLEWQNTWPDLGPVRVGGAWWLRGG